ncbi:STAS domain-containing protein [Pseudonocardia adelaidensis]|uniref:STAS domain-containing protein n=1 Tax=Pseudonocardia adelaidensis TaxID=648754 RepID=A0ABP9NSN8_9PSEU
MRVLTVSGALTGDRADRLCGAVREQLALCPRLLGLDMTRVTAVDTAGVRALVHVAHLAAEAAIRLSLVTGASTAVGATLEVNGLAELFEVCVGIDQVVAGQAPEGTRAPARRR